MFFKWEIKLKMTPTTSTQSIFANIDPKTEADQKRSSSLKKNEWSEEYSDELVKIRGSLGCCKGEKYQNNAFHIRNKNSMYIELMNSRSNGFGTAAIRFVVKKSLQGGFEGRVHLEATGSSHFFYLKMGMIPDDHKDFILKMIETLETNIDQERPNTEHLGKVNMVFSEEGLKRWVEAITNKKPFVCFRKFEHLHSVMMKDQIARLDAIMQKREQVFAEKTEITESVHQAIQER